MRNRSWLLISSIVLVASSLTVWLWKRSVHLSPQGHILFITKTLAPKYHQLIVDGVQQAAKQLNMTVEIFAPAVETDYESQIDRIHLLLQQKNGAVGVIIAPNNSSALVPSLVEMSEHHIPFVVVDTALSLQDHQPPLAGDCGYIGTDNEYGGMLAADYLGQHLSRGNILSVRGVHTHQTSIERERGFELQLQKYPLLHIQTHLAGDWSGEHASAALHEYLQQHTGKVDAIFAYSDPMAVAVANYYHETTLRPLIVGFNGDQEAQTAILAEQMDATVVQTPELMGKLAMERLHVCLQKWSNEDVRTPVSLLTTAKTLATQNELSR